MRSHDTLSGIGWRWSAESVVSVAGPDPSKYHQLQNEYKSWCVLHGDCLTTFDLTHATSFGRPIQSQICCSLVHALWTRFTTSSHMNTFQVHVARAHRYKINKTHKSGIHEVWQVYFCCCWSIRASDKVVNLYAFVFFPYLCLRYLLWRKTSAS